jgi:hypothetical protein
MAGPLQPEVSPKAPSFLRGRRTAVTAGAAAGGCATAVALAILTMYPTRAPVSQQASGPIAILASDDPIGMALPESQTLVRSDGSPWQGISTSTDEYGAIAVFSRTELWLSLDDGRTFTQRLGAEGDIAGVAIGGRGVTYVVRGDRSLGILHADGSAEWSDLPQRGELLAIAANQNRLALLTTQPDDHEGLMALLSTSEDLGESWHSQLIPHFGNHSNTLRIERNGSVELLLREEDADYDMVWRYRGHADGRPIEVASWPSDHEPHLGLAKGGWAYTLSTECADGALAVCSVSPEGHLSRVDTIEPSEWTFAVAGGSTTMAAVGRDLFQLDGSEGRPIGVSSPGEVDALAVDGIDRGVALVSGHLVRWSPRRGWRLLHRGGTLALR